MKSRSVSAILGVILFAVAVLCGALHDHQHGTLAPDHQCAACAWTLTATAIMPVVSVVVARPILERALPVAESAPLEPLFVISSASRAPPLASA